MLLLLLLLRCPLLVDVHRGVILGVAQCALWRARGQLIHALSFVARLGFVIAAAVPVARVFVVGLDVALAVGVPVAPVVLCLVVLVVTTAAIVVVFAVATALGDLLVGRIARLGLLAGGVLLGATLGLGPSFATLLLGAQRVALFGALWLLLRGCLLGGLGAVLRLVLLVVLLVPHALVYHLGLLVVPVHAAHLPRHVLLGAVRLRAVLGAWLLLRHVVQVAVKVGVHVHAAGVVVAAAWLLLRAAALGLLLLLLLLVLGAQDLLLVRDLVAHVLGAHALAHARAILQLVVLGLAAGPRAVAGARLAALLLVVLGGRAAQALSQQVVKCDGCVDAVAHGGAVEVRVVAQQARERGSKHAQHRQQMRRHRRRHLCRGGAACGVQAQRSSDDAGQPEGAQRAQIARVRGEEAASCSLGLILLLTRRALAGDSRGTFGVHLGLLHGHGLCVLLRHRRVGRVNNHVGRRRRFDDVLYRQQQLLGQRVDCGARRGGRSGGCRDGGRLR